LNVQQSPIRVMFEGSLVRGDREIVWTLVAIALCDLCAGVFLTIVPRRHGFLYFEVAIYLAAVLLQCLPLLRLRYNKSQPYSPAGFSWLLATVAMFIGWNLVIMLVAVVTRWLENPVAFDVSVIASLVPLLVGIRILQRKLQATEVKR
jgi:hypothetical protein